MLNLCKRRLLLTKANYSSASKRLTSKYTIAIRREDNVVWERRAPLAPTHVRKLVQDGIRVLVQPANKRAFPVQEYVSNGAEIKEDISEASVILGVKQVPVESLVPNKTYIFFSHVIKAQSENMAMLDAILEKNIRLIDYEKMEENSGKRVVAFGMYAGYAGMINILHGMGLRLLALGHHTPFMHIGIAHNYRTSGQAVQSVRDAGYEISLGRMPESVGPLTFVFTGAGNVSQGAQEIFRELPHVYVDPHELKDVAENGDTSMVYGCVVDMHDHLRRKSDGGYDMQEYIQSPHLYESIFAKEIAPYASCIMNGIFWRPQDPRLLTSNDIVNLQCGENRANLRQSMTLESPGCPRLPHRLIAVGDVSADPGGSLEFMTECTSIDAPFDMYDASTGSNSHGVKGPGILICSVDNLPAQLPREATQFFGDQLLPYMFHIADNDANASFSNIKKMSPVVTNAIIASNGKMTPKFEYIQDMRRKREQEGAMSATSSKHYKVLVLGAGYVSHPLLDYMTKHNDTDVTVASSIPSEIKSLSGKFKHTSPIVLDIELETERLEELVKGHDLVISLLPYSFHPKVADLCIGHKKNLVTASYVSDPIKERHQKAVDSGIGILMEMGLDPGIDHMLAMEAFDDIKGNNGKVTSFISYCGGLPAPELSSNPLKYKFSWSPAGVLMATLAPSKYLRDNQIIKHKEGGENYRNGVLPIDFMPGFNLEGLANRDSTSYKDKYGLYDCETLLRGTLRYKGSADVIVGLLNLGIITLDPHPLLTKQSPDITWKQFLGNLLANRQDMSGQELRDCVFETVGRSETRLKAIKELGLMSDEFVEKAKTPIHTLANHLNNILSYGKGERDMIILRHEIEGSYADKNEKRDIDMVIYGDPDKYSAMAKCVGYPCAIAARMMLLGKIEDKGVVTPMRKDIYQPLLEELRQLGITSKTSFK